MTAIQEQAFWEGHRAAKERAALSDNPYRERALFDSEQRAHWWNMGHKAHRDARIAAIRKGRSRAWNRA